MIFQRMIAPPESPAHWREHGPSLSEEQLSEILYQKPLKPSPVKKRFEFEDEIGLKKDDDEYLETEEDEDLRQVLEFTNAQQVANQKKMQPKKMELLGYST